MHCLYKSIRMKTPSFLYKLKTLLKKQDRKKLIVLLLMTILLSLIEVVGITAIIPFISTASNPDLIYSNNYYKYVYDILNLSSTKEFVVYFSITLILFYISRGVYLVFYVYMITKLSMGKYVEFADKIFDNYLNMPYSEHVKRNSATMTKVITSEVLNAAYIIRNILILLSEILIVAMIYIILLFVEPQVTFVLTILLSIKIIILLKTVSKKIKSIGYERADIVDKQYRIIGETLGNFKVIKFISNQEKIWLKFKDLSNKFSKNKIVNETLQSVSKSLLETVGFSIIIAVVLYVVVSKDNPSSVIAIISMYALALYRILPAITKILSSYNGIVFHFASIDMVYDDMSYDSKKEIENKQISFFNNIFVSNLLFGHNEKSNIIKNVNLQINKGDKIAFIGKSGSGKSTLVDLLCGIYTPHSGKILIDGIELDDTNIVSWRKRIGYIPQSIYLFDGTISENVTFGRDYDKEKLEYVLKQANIYELIMLKDGLNTIVGEGGIQLSGGQKQRIGIARALYGNPEILVLDESTSALDAETEKEIMDEIYKVSKNKTLIIIAHRLSTIADCDIQINLDKINK
jgi:ATP-binding cassette, subfamily B, bacterial PglK